MLKKVLWLCLIVPVLIFGADFVSDYKEGLAKAKAEKKLVALTIVQTYCPWCAKFKNETLKDKIVSQTLKQNFVHIMLNRDTQEIPSWFPRKIMVPTTFFLNANGDKISETATGYFPADDFKDFLEDAVKKGKK